MLTFLGLLAIVWWRYRTCGTMTFAIEELAEGLPRHPIPVAWQLAVFLALFVGVAIKVPLFPLHTWLPLAHVEAPTGGSVDLAGVLLKIGIYGFLRFSLPMLPEATALAAANKRVANILGKLEAGHPFGDVSADLLQEAEEKALSEQLVQLAKTSGDHLERDEYTEALACLASLRAPVDDFFDGVMVNVEEEKLRNNRLNLLKALHDLFLKVADISQLAVSK